MASRAALLAGTNAIYAHLRLFGLLMHVGSPGKKSKTEAMYCPARVNAYDDGDTKWHHLAQEEAEAVAAARRQAAEAVGGAAEKHGAASGS